MLSTSPAQGMEDIFASVSSDNTMRVWDIRQQKPAHVERTKEEIVYCQFNNKDGSVLATSNYSEEICFYDTKMWKVHKQFTNKSEVNAIMWNFDDSILFIADSSGKINLYDG